MEMEAMEENKQVEQLHVDTSRPFTSVKEAVATFGQRIVLPGKIHTLNSKPASPIASPSINQTAKPVSPITSPRISQTTKPVSPIPSPPQGSKEEFMDVLKKLEAEITETNTEVRMLKERESDTEVALASLNAELHKNIAKMAKTEADAGGKSAAAMNKALNVKEKKEKENGEEETKKKLMRKMVKEYPTLAQILDSNKNGYFAKTKKKKKPIVPLLGGFFFFNKKGSST